MENRIMQREESLDRRNDALDRKEHQLSSLQGQPDKRKNEVDSLYQRQMSELERISALTRKGSVADPAGTARPSDAGIRPPHRRNTEFHSLPPGPG